MDADLHALLSRLAASRGASASRLVGERSVHTFAAGIAIEDLRALANACRLTTLVGAVKDSLAVTVCPEPSKAKRKRRRDDDALVKQQVERLRKAGAGDEATLAAAEEAALHVSRLQSVEGLDAVSTWSLRAAHGRVSLVARIDGVALDAAELMRAVGGRDGKLSMEEADLPFSETASAGKAVGVRHATLHVSVAASDGQKGKS